MFHWNTRNYEKSVGRASVPAAGHKLMVRRTHPTQELFGQEPINQRKLLLFSLFAFSLFPFFPYFFFPSSFR